MKKVAGIAMGCLLSSVLFTNVALADNGSFLCSIPKQSLQQQGFTSGAIYSTEQIIKFFPSARVKLGFSDPRVKQKNKHVFKPGATYRVTYNCVADRDDPFGVAHIKLYAVESPLPANMLTPNTVTVKWKITGVHY